MHVAVGVHPTCVYATKWKDRKQLETFVKEEGVVAVGEAGLDFHYARKDQHRFWQKRWFIYQIKLAYEHKFPLVLHIRRADKAGMRILKRYKDKLVGGVLHCFNSGADVARQGVELGLYFGIGGALIGPDEERSARLREALTVIPLERILLETDAPFVLPQCLDQTGAPVSPKVRNASTVILAVAEEIARIKGVDLSTVQEVTTENAKKLFGI